MSDQDSSQSPPPSSKSPHSPFDMERLHPHNGPSISPASKSLPHRIAQSAGGLAHDFFGLRGNDAATTLAANVQMGGKSSQLNAGPSFEGSVTDSLVGSGASPVPYSNSARMPGPSFKSPCVRSDEASGTFEDFATQSSGNPALQSPSLGSADEFRSGAARLHRPQDAGETSHVQRWFMEFGRSNASMRETGHVDNVKAQGLDLNRLNTVDMNKHKPSFDAKHQHIGLTTSTSTQYDQAYSSDFGPLGTYHDQLRALGSRGLEQRAGLHATVPDSDIMNGVLPRPNQEASGSVQAQSPQTNQPPSLVDGLRSSLNARRITLDSPTHEVLPVALKNYGINEDPAVYSLFVVHDDQETCLGRDDRPLSIFRQLIDEGKKPMFMLRKIALPSRGSFSDSGPLNGWFARLRPRSGNMPPTTRCIRKEGEDRRARSLVPENNASDVNIPRGSSSPPRSSDQQTSPEAERGRAWVGQITTAMSAEHDDAREDRAKQDADDQTDTQKELARKTEVQDHEAEAGSKKPARSQTRSPLTAPHHHQPDSEPKSESKSFSWKDFDTKLRLLETGNNKCLQLGKESDVWNQGLAKERAQEQDRNAPALRPSVNEQGKADEEEKEGEEEGEKAKQSQPVRRLKMVLGHVPPPRSIPISLPPFSSSSPSPSQSQSPFPPFTSNYRFRSEPETMFSCLTREDFENQPQPLVPRNRKRKQLAKERRE